MKALLIATGAALLVAGCATTSADNTTSAPAALDPASPLSAPGYMSMAASSDLFEIESSRLALQQSQNPAVRAFAQMMIDHHTRTSADMMSVAQAAGMSPPPPQMLPPQMAALDRLRMAGPAEFDSAYKREQIAAHQQALDLHRNYAAQGDTPQLRDLATRTVPIIEQHWTQANGLPEVAPPPARSGERG